MKKLVMLTMAAAFACAAWADLDLNGTWQFRFEPGKSWQAADPAFEATDTMVVPGCFDALPKWFMKRGLGLYRRTFTLDRAVDNAWLVIDGMGLYGTFRLDGRDLGTDALPWSQVRLATGPLAAGAHTLFAAVDNRFDWSYQKLVRPYYDFQCWGGFYHGVSLAFENRRFFVRTRDYKTGTVEVEAVDFPQADFGATLVFDGRHEVAVSFKAGRATVAVPGFKLWSPDHPNLHTVALKTDGAAAPQLTTRFGIRTIEARARGFYLNGERIFLKGANRHDQCLLSGAATPESVMLADIQNLKAMGGNFFRGAHYPQSQRFLDLCDEHGVLVWEESLGWGNGQSYTFARTDGNDELLDPAFAARQLEQTTLMVRNSFNHPSVIIFAFLNECCSTKPACKKLVDDLIGAIRKEDSGRLVTFACNLTGGDVCHANTDIIAFNTYPGTINGYPGEADELAEKIRNMKGFGINDVVARFRQKYPDKTILISEMGTSALYGLHDPAAPRESEEFQDEHNRLVAETVWNNPDVAGLAFWQFFDTRTCGRECAQDGNKHAAMSWAGLFDAYRRPKMGVRTLTAWFKECTPANMKHPVRSDD